MVLQRTGDDLRCRGAALVDEDDERKLGRNLTRPRRVALGLARSPTARVDDRRACIEEEVTDVDPLSEQPARVAPEIQDQATHARATHFLDGSADLHRGRLTEDLQRQIADALVEHRREGYRLQLDNRPRDREGNGLIDTGAPDDDVDVGSRCATQHVGRLIGVPLLRRGALDLDDQVARPNAGALGRSTRKRRDHRDPAFLAQNLQADAPVLRLRPGPEAEVLPHLRIDQRSVGVTQALEHTLDRRVVDLGLVHGLDKTALHVVQNLLERPHLQVDVVLRLDPTLQKPATRDQGDPEHQNRRDNGTTVLHIPSSTDENFIRLKPPNLRRFRAALPEGRSKPARRRPSDPHRPR